VWAGADARERKKGTGRGSRPRTTRCWNAPGSKATRRGAA